MNRHTAFFSGENTSNACMVHVYGTTAAGENKFIGGYNGLSSETYINGHVVTGNLRPSDGTFDIIAKISSSNPAIKYLRFYVWSGDQSNMLRYHAFPNADGTYKATVNIEGHNGSTGRYYVDTYAVYNNGAEAFVTRNIQDFDPSSFLTTSENAANQSVTLLYKDLSAASVYFNVMSSGRGQRYPATALGNGVFSAEVPRSDISGYSFKVYVYSGAKLICQRDLTLTPYINWAITTANDDRVGYSMDHRILNPNVDCSAFVYFSLYYTGFAKYLDKTYPFSTSGEPGYLERCGFIRLPYTGMQDLLPGDILWFRHSAPYGHTEIYIGNGYTVGARDPGTSLWIDGDQTKNEVSVFPWRELAWMYVFRRK